MAKQRYIPFLQGLIPAKVQEAIETLYKLVHSTQEQVEDNFNVAQVGLSAGNITLTGVYQDVLGTILTLPRAGTYLIIGTFTFRVQGAGDNGIDLVGALNVDGTVQSKGAVFRGVDLDVATVAQQWLHIALSGGSTVKLVAYKTGGAGISIVGGNTVISALWVSA